MKRVAAGAIAIVLLALSAPQAQENCRRSCSCDCGSQMRQRRRMALLHPGQRGDAESLDGFFVVFVMTTSMHFPGPHAPAPF